MLDEVSKEKDHDEKGEREVIKSDKNGGIRTKHSGGSCEGKEYYGNSDPQSHMELCEHIWQYTKICTKIHGLEMIGMRNGDQWLTDIQRLCVHTCSCVGSEKLYLDWTISIRSTHLSHCNKTVQSLSTNYHMVI